MFEFDEYYDELLHDVYCLRGWTAGADINFRVGVSDRAFAEIVKLRGQVAKQADEIVRLKENH